MKIKLTTGLVINESILNFAYRYVDAGPGFKFDPAWGNHMSDKGNRDFARYMGNKIESYIQN